MPAARHVSGGSAGGPGPLVFGTAGHVDHGKSALVLALTGTDPDRLAEEKAREMTIDLGFAFLSLPGLPDMAAIVDVPGHEMFVRNMVAGATGIDAAIFVVAADEGVMPQTVEHLEVLRQLKIQAGVIALTKRDRVSAEKLRQTTEEVRAFLAGSPFEAAAIVPVSSITGEGLPELRQELARLAQSVRSRPAEGIFRLPVDRVFTLKGVGTVVTGTVISGALQVGEMVTCLPAGRQLRARALQVHGGKVERVLAGQRAAINLADVAKEDLHRGDVLATPGSLASTLMIDARANLSAGVRRPLEQRARVRVHHGTAEAMARVVLLEGDTLAPGESALTQLRLESPLAPLSGDPFVLRSYSPMLVIGGGTVVDPHPPKRRRAGGSLELEEREGLPAAEMVLGLLRRAAARGVRFDEMRVQCGLPAADLRFMLEELAADGRVCPGRRDLWFSSEAIEDMKLALATRLAELHAEEPLRTFAPLNAVAGPLASSPEERECFRVALDLLASGGLAVVAGERLRLASHRPVWQGKNARAREAILGAARARGLAAPTAAEIAVTVGLDEKECERVLEALADSGELHVLAPGLYLHPEVMAEARAQVRRHLEQHGTLTVAECRELLGASRKYLLPFLEQLDREGLTVRRGDYRELARR